MTPVYTINVGAVFIKIFRKPRSLSVYFLSFVSFLSLLRSTHCSRSLSIALKREKMEILKKAQLVVWSLLTPEVRGSNPVIGKNYIEH